MKEVQKDTNEGRYHEMKNTTTMGKWKAGMEFQKTKEAHRKIVRLNW